LGPKLKRERFKVTKIRFESKRKAIWNWEGKSSIKMVKTSSGTTSVFFLPPDSGESQLRGRYGFREEEREP